MQHFSKTLCALLTAEIMLNASAVRIEADEARPVSFVRQVAPILVGKCQGCHGSKTAESNYRIDTFQLLMTAGDFGMPPVTANNLDESEFHRLITSEDPDERMPNNGDRLSDQEIELINAWILQGAKFDGADPAAALRTQIPSDIPHPAAPETYRTALPITAMAFSVDGSQLLVGGYHELLVWDPVTGDLSARVGNIPQRTFGMAFSPDGSRLAVAGGASGVSGEVRLMRWANGAPAGDAPKVLATGEDVFFDVAFRPDGQQLAAAGYDGAVRVFDAATGVERLKISNHADWVTDVCYSPDGTLIASASRDKSAKVFDAETGRLVASFSDPAASVRGVAFSPDGKAVISTGGNLVRIWKIEDSTLIGELPPFQNEVQALLAGGGNVLAASADRSVREFKLADRTTVRSLTEHPAWVLSLALNEPTRRVATGCFNGVVTVWNLDDGAMVKQFLAAPPVAAPAE
jgi:WD40 repeat protein/mono/diheme cytochrome c family protein